MTRSALSTAGLLVLAALALQHNRQLGIVAQDVERAEGRGGTDPPPPQPEALSGRYDSQHESG